MTEAGGYFPLLYQKRPGNEKKIYPETFTAFPSGSNSSLRGGTYPILHSVSSHIKRGQLLHCWTIVSCQGDNKCLWAVLRILSKHLRDKSGSSITPVARPAEEEDDLGATALRLPRGALTSNLQQHQKVLWCVTFLIRWCCNIMEYFAKAVSLVKLLFKVMLPNASYVSDLDRPVSPALFTKLAPNRFVELDKMLICHGDGDIFFTRSKDMQETLSHTGPFITLHQMNL